MCAHCRENSGPDKDDLISSDVIQATFDQMDSSWLVSLQGGEPSLYLDKCAEIVQLAKSKRIMTAFYSNGWWGDDDKMIADILALKTDILVLSVNKWTSSLIPIERIRRISDIVKSHTTIGLIYSECYDIKPIMKAKLAPEAFVIDYRIEPVGRASNIHINPDPLCKRIGFTIETDGTVYGNCCRSTQGCRYGSIFDIRLKDHMERRKRCAHVR
jgi:MoaA/NifB/PqqE/SkfB family radical SAM enzyme